MTDVASKWSFPLRAAHSRVPRAVSVCYFSMTSTSRDLLAALFVQWFANFDANFYSKEMLFTASRMDNYMNAYGILNLMAKAARRSGGNA